MRTAAKHILPFCLLPVIFTICTVSRSFAQSRYGQNDTIITLAVVYAGDTIEAKTLAGVYVWSKSKYTAK